MKTHSLRLFSKITALFISFCLVCTLIPSHAFAYTVSQLNKYSAASVLETGNASDNDYLKLETDGSTIAVTFKHSQAFDRIILRLMQNGKSVKRDAYFDVQTGANKTFTQSYDFSGLDDGEYYFRIVTEKSAQGNAGLEQYTTYLQGILVSVSGGIPSLQQYHNISANNQEKTAIGSYQLYTQKSLEDLRYQLFAKKGTYSDYREVKASEADYYAKISNSIVSSGDSDYSKLKKIYTYVAKNFYYDHYGVANGKPGYDDPYNNLKYLNEKSGNDYNAYGGKVAMQCDGYAGVFTALARAQGIPCRIVYGKKITSGTHTWSEETGDMEKNSHTWVQAWADDRWITIDPQQGSYSSYSTTKKWLKTVLVNYTFFDISDDLFAYTHYSRELPGGNKTAAYITAKNEVTQLKSFLNIKSGGKTNGKRLNSAYSATKKNTWGTTKTLYTDGFGRVERIEWAKKNLSGKMNLSGFTSLKNLTIYLNNLTTLNTKNCSALETVYASGNQITSVDLASAKSLKKADYKNNPLTSAKLYTNKKNVTISAQKGGTFSFKYENNKVTFFPEANPGYKYTGIYNAAGKRLSTNKTSYTCKATSKSYKLKFALDPKSFKYYLKQGNNASLSPWNLAVQKRLKELNYFKSATNGKYNKATTTAVKAFQKKNGLKQTGNVDEKTWSKLFSTKAKKK